MVTVTYLLWFVISEALFLFTSPLPNLRFAFPSPKIGEGTVSRASRGEVQEKEPASKKGAKHP